MSIAITHSSNAHIESSQQMSISPSDIRRRRQSSASSSRRRSSAGASASPFTSLSALSQHLPPRKHSTSSHPDKCPPPKPPPTSRASVPSTALGARSRAVDDDDDEDDDDGLPPTFHSGSFVDNFQAQLHDINLDDCDAHGENAFFVCDLAEVWRQHQRWLREFGTRVIPFYAVKCNPDPFVLKLLAALGLGFDCASQPEIAAVLDLHVQLDPSRIVYANPCKAASFVRHAAANGIDYMTFDNADELKKIKKFHPRARMIVRILTDDSGSLCRLGTKFGAPLREVKGLLKRAKELDVNVVGVSFHCGSGCTNPALFADAVKRARWAFDVAEEIGFKFDLLDVGGGFEDHNFEAIATHLRGAFDEHFPLDGAGAGVRIIAEPGRYYVSKAFQLATNIIARRGIDPSEHDAAAEAFTKNDDEVASQVMYYINDGVYGSFNCVLFDHQVVHPRVLTLGDTFYHEVPAWLESELQPCSVWGPTCDSIDLVTPSTRLPTERLEVGDWLLWQNMGAYTICAASQFNGFRRSQVRYTIDTNGDPDVDARLRHLVAPQEQSSLST